MGNIFRTAVAAAITIAAFMAVGVAPASADPVADLSPASHAYGQQVLDTESSPFEFTLSNTGDGSYTIVSVAKAGPNPGQFTIKNATTCDTGVVLDTVTPACTIRVTFKPGSLGDKTAQIAVVTSLSATPITVAVTGTGITLPIAAIGTSGVTVPFPEIGVLDGPTVTQSVVVVSEGGGPLQIGAITLTGNDPTQFTMDATACQNRTLPDGDNCGILVAFDPDSPGSKTARISIDSDAQAGSPTTIALAGSGVAPPLPPGSVRLKIASKLPEVRPSANIVRVPVTCVRINAPICKARLTLSAKGNALGFKGKKAKKTFRLGSHSISVTKSSLTVAISLKGFAKKALRQHRILPLTITTEVKQPDGTVVSGKARRKAVLAKP